VVAEGFCDTKKFNVNRIWKPAVKPLELHSNEELQVYKKHQGNKALEIMVACGPYTVNNELSYEALKDLIAVISRDRPHVLILSGPFVSCNHEDVVSGDLRYRDLQTGELCFMDYN